MKTAQTSPDAPVCRTKRRVSAFVLLMIATFFVRGGVVFSSLNSFNDDPDDYRRLAENWYSFGVFGTDDVATAFRPPLYPWTLKALVPLRVPSERPPKVDVGDSTGGSTDSTGATGATGATTKISKLQRFFDVKIALSRNASIALWHWLLGVATVAVVYRIGRRLDFGEWSAAGAAFFVAVDPILLQQSRLVMTETLAAFFAASLILGTIFVLERRTRRRSSFRYAALGAAFGLSALCRPAFLAFAGLVFLEFAALEFVERRRQTTASKSTGAAALGRVAAFLLGIGAVVAPWTARNVREFGRPIVATTHGGYTLYLANNPEIYDFYRTEPVGALWNPSVFHRRRALEYAAALREKKIAPNSKEAELFQNEWTRAEANATIAANRSTFLWASLVRVVELWRVLPNDVSGADAKSSGGETKTTLNAVARRAVAVFYLVEFAFAAFGLVALFAAARRRRRRPDAEPNSDVRSFLASPWFVGFLLIASVQIPHWIYWTNMRMRAPLEIFLPLLALFGARALGFAFAPKNKRGKNVDCATVATEKVVKTNELSA